MQPLERTPTASPTTAQKTREAFFTPYPMKLSKSQKKPLGEPQKPEKRREESNRAPCRTNADMIHQERKTKEPERIPRQPKEKDAPTDEHAPSLFYALTSLHSQCGEISPLAFFRAFLKAFSIASGLLFAVTVKYCFLPPLSEQLNAHFAILRHPLYIFAPIIAYMEPAGRKKTITPKFCQCTISFM